MFSFAQAISIVRKSIRKGVLYFIRDPADPEVSFPCFSSAFLVTCSNVSIFFLAHPPCRQIRLERYSKLQLLTRRRRSRVRYLCMEASSSPALASFPGCLD